MNKYMQTDKRWGNLGYPKAPYCLRNCGCGEVSICNIIIETDKYAKATPKTILRFCRQFADPNGNGTYWSGIPVMMKHYGLTEVQEHQTMKPLWTELAKGNRVAVFLMGSKAGGSKGVHWTSSGHFVCGTKYKYENGKHWVYIKDSYSNSKLRNGWIAYEDNMRNDVLKVWSGKLPASEKAYVPNAPYENGLPVGTVQYGTTGSDLKHLKTFLNWCINADLHPENKKCANKTVNAIKRFQTQYGLEVDGIFGAECRKKAKEIIKKYAKNTWADDANAFAKKIANDNSYHYKLWTKNVKTHYCPICKNYPKGEYHGWNCIGFASAVWHHGGGLGNKCWCGMISSETYEKILYAKTDAEALALAQKYVGIKELEVIRNTSGIPKSKWKAGDHCAKFDGKNYKHTFYYMGNGKVADSSNWHSDKDIAVRDYTNYTAKVIIRYTGDKK